MASELRSLFAKNGGGETDPKVRAKAGALSGGVGLACNILLCIGKLLVGTLSGSVSITADAMNNLSDSASALVTLIGFKLAERPADEDHPYGHARYEYLSGLAVAGMILVIGFELAKTSVNKILNPEPVQVSGVLVGVLIASVLVKLTLYLFNQKLGKAIGSSALLATAADSRNDAVSTTAVLVAALAERFSGLQIDGFMGLAVAIFVLYSGINMGKETISPLLGETASPELRQRIVDTISAEPLVLGYHDLMVHDYGPGQRFASLHVEMDEKEDPLLCHEIIDDLERLCLEKHNVHLVIHYDPLTVGDPYLDALKQTISQALTNMDSRLTFHDFRMVRGAGHTNLIFDVAVPPEMNHMQKEITRAIEKALAEDHQGTYYLVITFDSMAFN